MFFTHHATSQTNTLLIQSSPVRNVLSLIKRLFWLFTTQKPLNVFLKTYNIMNLFINLIKV